MEKVLLGIERLCVDALSTDVIPPSMLDFIGIEPPARNSCKGCQQACSAAECVRATLVRFSQSSDSQFGTFRLA
ncbi:hypothetical protein AB0M05_00160 [Streptomyces violaceusniger]|uniref:hypothetical protein n=1 Tax=Streptomyces violaceusniger TaxID=68280 RepID=UPI003443F7E4